MADPLRQMLEDLSHVAETPTEQLQALGDSLEEQTEYFSDERLARFIAEAIPDESQGGAIYNTLKNVSVQMIPTVLEAVAEWRNAKPQNLERFPDEKFNRLSDNLRMIVRDYAAIGGLRKAEHLETILGNELRGFTFICDARPVYDNDRRDIEAFIPITTLKTVYLRQNGIFEEIEFQLTGNQLDMLIKQAEEAKQKLKVLEGKMQQLLGQDLPDDGNQ